MMIIDLSIAIPLVLGLSRTCRGLQVHPLSSSRPARIQALSPRRIRFLCGSEIKSSSVSIPTATGSDLAEGIAENLQQSFHTCRSSITRTCKVLVGASSTHRLGLIATESVAKGDVLLSIPFDEKFSLTAALARKIVFADVLPKSDESWTGEMGLIALLILNEVARACLCSSTATDSKTVGGEYKKGTHRPERTPELQSLMTRWVESLPLPKELDHPLLWNEEDQEILQSSSTRKIYRILDDVEEDAAWYEEHLFDRDRNRRFPESVTLSNGKTIECFTVNGFKWAYALAQSRSFFLDRCLRLIPILDCCNHDDAAEEVRTSGMGAFGNLKGAQLVASQSYKAGDEVLCSYGPKSAADYLLEHGFCPKQVWTTSVSEITFEIDASDRFYDDKIDILENETYEQAPMSPLQSFDVISARGRDGEPDAAMLQFLRLAKLGGTDAFLLESIFRRDVWGFMSLPVSEMNELDVVNTIIETCQAAGAELASCPANAGPLVCKLLRENEIKAMTRTSEFMQREREALDLKEYYQQRRLKDLGLDSDWTPEEDYYDSDLGFGQTRVPGGADYDW